MTLGSGLQELLSNQGYKPKGPNVKTFLIDLISPRESEVADVLAAAQTCTSMFECFDMALSCLGASPSPCLVSSNWFGVLGRFPVWLTSQTRFTRPE